ncbi:hypothetical protein K3495_g11208 [Podosphaera aphanis]|nr:hypothetical protein K3495_g11208 [Podosphaera aphanis]
MNQPQTPPLSPAPRPYTQRLTRDQRLQVKTLADEGYSRQKISERLSITVAQVRYALKIKDLTPKKRSGRPRVLSTAKVDEIEAFVCLSSENRQIPYFELAHRVFQHFGVSEKVIAREMKERGYSRQSGGLTEICPFLRK